MRKIICFAMGAAVLASAFGLAGCKKDGGGDTSTYNIHAEYVEETQKLTAEMTAEIVNTTPNPLSELKFQLWPNAYRADAKHPPVSELFSHAAYYNGANYGGISIKGVAGAESFEVGGEDENILTLKLASPLNSGACANVSISFDVQLANINHRLGVTEHTVNLANFYPVLCYLTDAGFVEYTYSSNGDPFVSEIANYDVTLTVPENYIVASGFAAEELADDDPEDGKRAYHVRANGVRDVAFVLGESLQSVTENADGTEVAYYYFDDASPETALNTAVQSLTFFSETFGDYAYPRYTVVQTDFVYGGMEFPALSMIASDVHASELATVIAHETAHQWWYAMVGSNQYECGWQDEGLAEYSTALFFEAFPDYGVSYTDFVCASESSYRAFFSVYSQLHGEANTAMNRPLSSFTGEYEYRNIAYDKGVILFDRVREVAGTRKFNNALRRYFETYSGKIATPAQLIGCFSKSGANVSALFTSFIEGKCVI